jgi:4-diphosphocytidyl-2-C-methyl-D-erythritol kinase
LKLVNEVLALKLTTEELAAIGAELGADVPFFIYGYPAANVSGIGEVIEPFEDDIPQIELKLMPFHCDTAKVYANYRQKFMENFEIGFAQQLKKQTSRQILATIAPMKANDLYASAIDLCPKLKPFSKEYFLSGSGSTLFRSKE